MEKFLLSIGLRKMVDQAALIEIDAHRPSKKKLQAFGIVRECKEFCERKGSIRGSLVSARWSSYSHRNNRALRFFKITFDLI